MRACAHVLVPDEVCGEAPRLDTSKQTRKHCTCDRCRDPQRAARRDCTDAARHITDTHLEARVAEHRAQEGHVVAHAAHDERVEGSEQTRERALARRVVPAGHVTRAKCIFQFARARARAPYVASFAIIGS